VRCDAEIFPCAAARSTFRESHAASAGPAAPRRAPRARAADGLV